MAGTWTHKTGLRPGKATQHHLLLHRHDRDRNCSAVFRLCPPASFPRLPSGARCSPHVEPVPFSRPCPCPCRRTRCTGEPCEPMSSGGEFTPPPPSRPRATGRRCCCCCRTWPCGNTAGAPRPCHPRHLLLCCPSLCVSVSVSVSVSVFGGPD